MLLNADRLWLWCCNFAPIMAVSLVRRAARTGDVTLMRTLANPLSERQTPISSSAAIATVALQLPVPYVTLGSMPTR
ncbi:hypothetical protein [Arthrobacter sp. LAR12-1-1.1]|uniref:hypothetical protein n=1 Tax=Arthrobacter sp. LAR12-1-1.1 TaxID=3135215 RepID=UPI00342B11D5